MDTHPDILIAGGGMVGATLACALARPGRSIWLIERSVPPAWHEADPPNLRVSAISLANQQYLDRIGIWPEIDPKRYTAYDSLATWEWLKTPWGVSLPPKQATRFHADELKVPHLGMIVENRALQRAALDCAARQPGVKVLSGQSVDDLTWSDGRLNLSLDGHRMTPKLVVGADGAQSRIRDAAN
ncbi:MAG: ubiquinone biosynthesis protein UbiH, partial [Gammaproteobacteria bacterium]